MVSLRTQVSAWWCLTECMTNTLMLFDMTWLFQNVTIDRFHLAHAVLGQCSIQIRSHNNQRNSSSTQGIFCALVLLLKMLLKARNFNWDFWSVGAVCRSAAGFYSRSLQNVVCFRCPMPTYFWFRVGSHIYICDLWTICNHLSMQIWDTDHLYKYM